MKLSTSTKAIWAVASILIIVIVAFFWIDAKTSYFSSNGDYVLAWSASTSDGNGYDVFVQRFDGASNLAAGPMSQLHGEAGNYGDGGDNNVKLVALTGGG